MRQLLAVIFLFTWANASTQQLLNYNFRHIDQSDGLLHNEILCLTQDATGYIWIGSANGLQRFDGECFSNFQQRMSDRNPTFTAVENVQFDKRGNLWLSNIGNIGQLQLSNNRLVVYSPDALYSDTSLHYDLYKDERGRVWKLGASSLYYYDTLERAMRLYCFDLPGGGTNASHYIIHDNRGARTWVSTWDNLLLFDAKTKKVYRYKDSFTHPLLQLNSSNGFSKMMLDADGNVWVASWHHLLYQYNSATNRVSTYSLSDIKRKEGGAEPYGGTLLVNCIFQDSRNNIWIGTENAGLLRYNRGSNSFDYVVSDEENKQGLHYNYNIFCIFQDKDENIWLGTDKGINIFSPYHQYFRSLYHQQHTSATIPKNEITAIVETTQHDLLVGTWGGGLSLYDSNFQFKKNIRAGGRQENNLVWSFLKNNKEDIWVGCQHGYIHRYNPVTQKILQTIHPPELQNSTVRCMQKDSRGNIWLGLHNGKIARWDSVLNKFFPFADTSINVALMQAPVFNLFIDRTQNLWAATGQGLKRFDPATRSYAPGVAGQPSKFYGPIHGIEQFDDSLLLVGSQSNGLHLFNTRTGKYKELHVDMPGRTVMAVKKNRQGHFLFTTDYGLYESDLQNMKVFAYKIDPGLINAGFTSNNFVGMENGSWLTFTATDIISFSPDSISRAGKQGGHVTITGFRIFDSLHYIDTFLLHNEPIKLSYHENFFTVEFAVLQFNEAKELKYYYKLSGIDNDWVDAGSKRFASYTSLEPGNYLFSVKAERGNQPLEPTSFALIIAPPFWKTWWFNLFVLATGLILLYFILRKIIRTIQFEAGLKHKIIEAEVMALRAQMNPHFIFNCLTAIDNLIQIDEKDRATTYLARFAKLIRVVLDNSKHNVVPFYSEYEAVSLFLELEKFRCSDSFCYDLKVDDELMNGDYRVPPFLVQPFIENAIHHGLMNKPGRDRKLSVEIKVKEERIIYRIWDNGIGRQRALEVKNLNKPEHASYGISLSTARAHLFGNARGGNNVVITDLYNEGIPSGTLVEVHINVANNK